MDGKRFDALARLVVTASDRRRLLAGLGGLALVVGGAQVAEARCTPDGRRCGKKSGKKGKSCKKCCSGCFTTQGNRRGRRCQCCPGGVTPRNQAGCCSGEVDGEGLCTECDPDEVACAGRVCGKVNNCSQEVQCGPPCPAGSRCTGAGQCECVECPGGVPNDDCTCLGVCNGGLCT